MTTIKRIYAEPSEADGFRVLVDRLCPRGMTKERARVDLWLKDIAPTPGLRQWFGHDTERWSDFVKQYLEELETRPELLALLADKSRQGTVTLLFASRDEDHNEAVVLHRLLNAPESPGHAG